MGHTLVPLANKPLKSKAIFSHRFVVEAVENFHIHYRNLRISLSKEDFIAICTGCVQAFERWSKRGCPEAPEAHIELCRKNVVGNDTDADSIRINLNENLYNRNQGKIFAEGADFTEDRYIHLKIRDLRLEMSIEEFKELENAVKEASGRLDACRVSSVL